jgi:hypothetical protein
MSLDGLRAWIGEVERKLAMRTRVFLVLTAVAIGGAGAAIYLAIEAENSNGGASSEEVQALREEVESQGGASPQISTLEREVAELRAEVEGLKAGGTGSGGAGSGGAGVPESEAKPVPEKEAAKP